MRSRYITPLYIPPLPLIHIYILSDPCGKQFAVTETPLHWGHNGRDGVSNHQHHHCLLNHLFRRRSKKTSKLRVTGLCAGNSLVTGEYPEQMASNAEIASIWWRHHAAPKFQRNFTMIKVHYIESAGFEKKKRFTITSLALGESYDCHSSNNVHVTLNIWVRLWY